MENCVVEYLIIVKHKGSFLNSVETFNKLLESHSEIKISNRKASYNSIEFDYEVASGEVKEKDQRYFKIKICSASYDQIVQLSEFLKLIRSKYTEQKEQLMFYGMIFQITIQFWLIQRLIRLKI